jgi:hypothetical protein
MPEITDLTDDEYDALHDLDTRTEDTRIEYAVVYFKRGKPVAEGPFTERHAAEANARNKRGVIAERIVTIDFGLWAPSDPRGHV